MLDDGTLWEFSDASGEVLARVDHAPLPALLWRYVVMVPEKFCIEGLGCPWGLVKTEESAKDISERILCATILEQ